MGFIIFISIAQALLIAGHIFLYVSWVKFLHLTDWRLLLVLRAGLLVLSVSFLSSSLLVHWRGNILTRAFYYLSSIWLGLLLYLFLAAWLTWTILLLAEIFSVGVSSPLLSGAVLVLGILYSAYGLVNAANPALSRIEVTIPKLPETWKGRRAVQISDIHLGAINGERFLERVMEKVNSVKPDIVFITGDLFDGIGDDLGGLCRPLSGLNAPLGVIFINGNHETYIGVEKAVAALSGLPVTVLRDSLIEIDGVQILGIDYPAPGEKKDFDSILSNIDRDKPSILLYHSPVHISKFKEYGTGLQLSGHTHRGQLWPLNYITRRVYRGYDSGLHREESFSLYTSTGVGTWGPPMRTGNRPEIVVIEFR